MATNIPLPISSTEADKLLQLIGHDDHTIEIHVVELVRALYRARAAGEGAGLSVLGLSDEQLMTVHRYFSPNAFGQGGREFAQRLSEAFLAWDRADFLPELPTTPTAEDEDSEAKQIRLALYRARQQ